MSETGLWLQGWDMPYVFEKWRLRIHPGRPCDLLQKQEEEIPWQPMDQLSITQLICEVRWVCHYLQLLAMAVGVGRAQSF